MPQPTFKNIDFTSQGRLPVTGVGFGFDNIGDARDNRVSTKFVSLDGEWDFLLYDSLDRLHEGIELIKDYRSAGKITVPGDWQLLDKTYRWVNERFEPNSELTPPDDINSVGVYHRTIDVTTEMLERELFLQLDGVGSSAEIYLNGCYIGFCQSAYDAHRFCLADFASLGENHLTIIVYRYSHGSCLEDNDGFRMSGIFRSVWLCGEPIFNIIDFTVTPELSEDYSEGKLNVKTDISIKANLQSLELWCILYDSRGRIVSKEQETVFSIAPTEIPLSIPLCVILDNPILWSDENPYLYRLVFFLQDNLGNLLDLRAVRLGFRDISISSPEDGTQPRVMLNGRPLKLFGTAYEEWHPDLGRSLSCEQLTNDLELIKRCNLNSIMLRYPASDMLYDICDELGLLVIAQPAVDTRKTGKKRKFAPFIRERVHSMLTRLKNHPSIILWGAEQEQIPVLAELSKEYSLPIIERDINLVCERNFKTIDKLCNKVQKPILLYDYIDVEGNSLGYLSELVAIIRKKDCIVGGFISNFIIGSAWDGNDFHITTPEGVLQPDRSPNPTAFELKQCLSPVEISLQGAYLTVKNNNRFMPLENHFISWEIRLDGLARTPEFIELPKIKVGESHELLIPYPAIATNKAIDLVVNLHNKGKQKWSDSERSICSCHDRLQQRTMQEHSEFIPPTEEENAFFFNGGGCSYSIDKTTGFMTSIRREGFEFLTRPIRPQLSRVCKEREDEGKSLLNSVKRLLKIGFWQQAEERLRLKKITSEPDCLRSEFSTDGIRQLTIIYRCNSEGELSIEFSAKAAQPINRLGLTFETVSELRDLACFALGPNENYSNRKKAAVPVLLQGTREELCHHYLSPRENGNRTGAEWLMLYGNIAGTNRVMLITARDRPVDISVHPYQKENLQSATDIDSLQIVDNMTVNIDAANAGIGDVLRSSAVAKPEVNNLYTMKIEIQISRQ